MYISAGGFDRRIYVDFFFWGGGGRRNLCRLFWVVKVSLPTDILYSPCIFTLICSGKMKIYGKIFTIIVENIENSVIYTRSSQIMCVVYIWSVWCMRRHAMERCVF